jgi:hypothetical protein
MNMIRNAFVTLGLASVLLSGAAFAEPKVTVYKSPSCSCCKKWAAYLEENGFEVESIEMNDLRMIKSMAGVKPSLASCHTAQVDGYAIEGHVPAEDIRRLLAERPDVKGLTVPGMPQGAPGMETGHTGHYQVLSIDNDGNTQVFAEH